MTDALAEFIRQGMQSRPWMAGPAVFIGGVITAANPCSLASVPVLIGLVGGQDAAAGWWRGLRYSLTFVAGLATSFSIMAVAAVSAGAYFGSTNPLWPWLIALVCLLAATQFWDLWHLSLPAWLGRIRPTRSGLAAALGMGLLFGVISAPCAAPVLVLVLTYAASEGNLAYGLVLLWIYAVGHCALVIAAGTSVGGVKRLLASERYARANVLIRRVAGVLIALAGLSLILDQLRAGA
jgi:cytochrome c-type biogenesis protein